MVVQCQQHSHAGTCTACKRATEQEHVCINTRTGGVKIHWRGESSCQNWRNHDKMAQHSGETALRTSQLFAHRFTNTNTCAGLQATCIPLSTDVVILYLVRLLKLAPRVWPICAHHWGCCFNIRSHISAHCTNTHELHRRKQADVHSRGRHDCMLNFKKRAQSRQRSRSSMQAILNPHPGGMQFNGVEMASISAPRLCPVSTSVQPLQSGSSLAVCCPAAAAAYTCPAARPLLLSAAPMLLPPGLSVPCCCRCAGCAPSSSCSSRPRLRRSSLMARAQLRMPSCANLCTHTAHVQPHILVLILSAKRLITTLHLFSCCVLKPALTCL